MHVAAYLPDLLTDHKCQRRCEYAVEEPPHLVVARRESDPTRRVIGAQIEYVLLTLTRPKVRQSRISDFVISGQTKVAGRDGHCDCSVSSAKAGNDCVGRRIRDADNDLKGAIVNSARWLRRDARDRDKERFDGHANGGVCPRKAAGLAIARLIASHHTFTLSAEERRRVTARPTERVEHFVPDDAAVGDRVRR